MQQLQESIEICGECKQLPVLHQNLGLIYARKGDIQEGRRELEMALKIDPNALMRKRLCRYSAAFRKRASLLQIS